MTPKEKANELYSYYDNLLNKDFVNPVACDNVIKQCALRAITEILIFGKQLGIREPMMFLYKVEQEIERL